MFELYTEKARRVIFFARAEASQFGSPYIETEHLLLGLLREEKCLAAEILYARGLRLSSIREQLTTVEVATKVTGYPCKICGTLNPTDVCGFSRFAWHEHIAELEAALKQAEDILAHELEESSLDDVQKRERIEDALRVIRKVLPGKGEK